MNPTYLLSIVLLSFSCSNVLGEEAKVHKLLEKCETAPKDDLLECSGLVEQIEKDSDIYGKKSFVPKNESEGFYKLCGDTEKCLENLNCNEANDLKNELENSCISIERDTRFLLACMEYFYAEVYYNSHTCSSEFQFESKNPKAHQNALISGKSCVLEIVSDVCFSDAKPFLDSDKYEKIIKSFTTKPEAFNCDDTYYLFDSQHCRHFPRTIKNATEEFDALPAGTALKGHKGTLDLVKLYSDALNCWEGRCFRDSDGATIDSYKQKLEHFKNL